MTIFNTYKIVYGDNRITAYLGVGKSPQDFHNVISSDEIYVLKAEDGKMITRNGVEFGNLVYVEDASIKDEFHEIEKPSNDEIEEQT